MRKYYICIIDRGLIEYANISKPLPTKHYNLFYKQLAHKNGISPLNKSHEYYGAIFHIP